METPLYTPDDDLVRKVKRQQAMDASAQADAEQQRQQAQTLSDAALRSAARGNTQSSGGDGLLPGGAAVGAAVGATKLGGGDFFSKAMRGAMSGAQNIGDAWRSGMPGAAAEVPANTGSLRYVADGARSIGGALVGTALRAAPGVAGFLSGSGLLADPPNPQAVGGNNQPATDIPKDVSDQTKAWMLAPNANPTPPREPGSVIGGWLRDSRDGIRSAMNNMSWDSVRGNLQALPGGSALSAVGNLAGVGARTSRMAGLMTEGAMLDKAGVGLGRGAAAADLVPRSAADPVAAFAASAGPVTSASRAGQRVAGIADRNPELFDVLNGTGRSGTAAPGLAGVTGATTSVPGITKLTGGQFRSPMFTDDPARAANEYGSTGQGAPTDRLTTVPSTANGDRGYLAAAFNRHVASGDIDRAMATANPNDPTQQAAIGNMLRQNQMAQAQAAQEEPLQRMMMQALERSIKPQGDIRDHAFGGPMRGGRGGGGTGAAEAETMKGVASMIGQMLAGQKSAPQASPMAQALAQAGTQQQQQQTQQAGALDNALKSQQLNAGKLMEALRVAAMNETDPVKRAGAIEALLAAQGKSTKDNPNRIIKLTVPFGEPNPIDGKRSMRDILYDMDAGKFMDPAEQMKQPQLPREQVIAEAKAAVAKGANKDAVNAHAMKLFGFAPL